MANYSVFCGTLYGYKDNNTSHGAFSVYFDYDDISRSGTSVTITNASVRCVSASTGGYTTNTIYINSCSVEGTDMGLSGSFNGKTYYKKSYSTSTVTKTISVASSDTSLDIAINGGRSAATSAQNFSGSITVDPGSYAVYYDANGGSGAPSSQEKIHDVTLYLSSTEPIRGNSTENGYTITYDPNGGYLNKSSDTAINTFIYTFMSWNTSPNGTGTTYNPGDSYTSNSSVTLYAQWSQETSYGSIRLPIPSREGHSFLGWGASPTDTSGFTGEYYPMTNRTLYAIWKEMPSLINWRDSNGQFNSGGTISIKDSNSRWLVVNKINIRNSSGEFEEH